MKLDPWMTDPKLAAAVLRWMNAGKHPGGLGSRTDVKFLEPSAGEGAFALPLALVPGIDLTAVELHGGRAKALRAAFEELPQRYVRVEDRADVTDRLARRQVVCRDFVAWAEEHAEKNPSDLFDVTIGNPPFADEQDCDHVAAMLRISWRVVVLLRLNFLAGGGRADAIFRNAWLRRLAILSSRPTFIDRCENEAERKQGSPRHDFAVFELIPRGALSAAPAQSIEWWDRDFKRCA